VWLYTISLALIESLPLINLPIGEVIFCPRIIAPDGRIKELNPCAIASSNPLLLLGEYSVLSFLYLS